MPSAPDPRPPAAAPAPAGVLTVARQRRLIAAAVLLLCAAVLGITTWFVRDLAAHRTDKMLQTARLEARVVLVRAEARLDAVGGLLEAVEASGAWMLRRSRPAVLATALRSHAAAMPALHAIVALDSDGRVQAASEPSLAGRSLPALTGPDGAGAPEAASRFVVLDARPAAALGLPGGLDHADAFLLPVVLPVDPSQGAGWLVALVDLDEMGARLGRLLGADATDHRLVDRRGRTLARDPVDVRGTPAWKAWEGGGSSYLGRDAAGRPVVAAAYASSRWELLALVETPDRALADTFAEEGTVLIGAALLTCLLIGVLGGTLARRLAHAAAERAREAALHDQVRRAERRWDEALAGAGHGAWDYDFAAGLAHLSAGTMALAGFPAQEATLPTARWLSLIHPDDLPAAQQAMAEHLAGRAPRYVAEHRIGTADGGWLWVRAAASATPERDAAGRPRRVAGTLTDISERRRAEARLQALQARQQAVLDGAADAIVTIDEAGVIVEFNPAAERIFGHAAAEAIGQPMHALIVPPEMRGAHDAALRHHLATGEARILGRRRVDVEALHADGRRFPIELTVMPAHTEAGRYFTATMRDVTAQRAAEQALRESEARFRALFEQTGVGMLRLDGQRRVLAANAAFTRLLGWTEAEWRDLPPAERVHPDDLQDTWQLLRALVVGPRDVVTARHRYRHKDGRTVVARVTASVTRRAPDGTVEILSLFEDVTESEAALRELAASEARFRGLFEQASVGMALQGLDRRVQRANRALTVLLGYEEQEMIGRLPTDALDAETDRQARERLGRLMRGEAQRHEAEMAYRRKDGRTLWLRTTTTLLRDAEGRPHQILTFLEDITERRRAEAQLATARERELAVGREIQRTLLGAPIDQRLNGVWLSSLAQASQGVDGDFAELIPLGRHVTDLVVGDVMGKGVAAALMGAGTKMQISRCLAALLAEPDRGRAPPSPAEIVGALARAVTPGLQALDAFVTLTYVRIDAEAGTVTWVGCGSEEPLLVGADGTLVHLPNQHPPLGIAELGGFQQQTLPLAPGSALFVASDGAADALMPDGSRFGRERLDHLVRSLLAVLPTPAAMLHVLRREIAATGARITDDLTMTLGVASGDPCRASRRELPAEPASIAHVRGLVNHRALQLGLGEVEASLFTLACVEAFTNAIRHTRGRPADAPIELVVRSAPEALVVEIVTLGEPFRPVEAPPPAPLEDYPEGGFGLAIMQLAASEVEHHHARGVNVVRLTLRTQPRP